MVLCAVSSSAVSFSETNLVDLRSQHPCVLTTVLCYVAVRGKDATTTTTTKVMEVVAPSTPIVDKPTQSEIEEVVDEQEAEVSEELPAVQVVEVCSYTYCFVKHFFIDL